MGAVPRFGGGLSRFKGESVDGEQEPSEGEVTIGVKERAGPLLPDSRARSREVAPERAEKRHISSASFPRYRQSRPVDGHGWTTRT